MIEQPEKSTLSAFATPQDVLDELDISRIIDSVSDEHEKRIHSSIRQSFYVFPRSAGLYTVHSVDEGTIENTYNVNLHFGTSACSCTDYLIRCTGKGMGCKHIWRVRLLTKIGALPAKNQDPFSWIISELYKDKKWLKDNIANPDRDIKELSKLENKVTDLGRDNVYYETIMKKRARIMMNASLG